MRSQASETVGKVQMFLHSGEKFKEIGKTGERSNVFAQGSDLELLYWEADTGKRVDWDEVSRYQIIKSVEVSSKIVNPCHPPMFTRGKCMPAPFQ